MSILEALQKGTVKGILEVPERHIETVMSDVLLYQDVVRKVYKSNREGVFLDLRDLETRRQFYVDDFHWNQAVSPHIHFSLQGAIPNSDGTYSLVEPEKADEWVITMKRIDDSDTLFRRLNDGAVGTKEVAHVTITQTKGLDDLRERFLQSDYPDLLETGLQNLWEERLDKDLRKFGSNFGESIPLEKTNERIDILLKFFQTHPFFTSLTSADAAIAIDNHAGNIVFDDDVPHFIDIYLVKKEWRVIDRHNNIARLATCVRVLGGDKLAQTVYDTYSKIDTLAKPEIYQFQEAYNALIKGYYYTYLKQPDVADKYFAHADSIIYTKLSSE